MTVDLTKEERIQYERCLGQCTTSDCLLNGECDLQKKIKEEDGEKNES